MTSFYIISVFYHKLQTKHQQRFYTIFSENGALFLYHHPCAQNVSRNRTKPPPNSPARTPISGIFLRAQIQYRTKSPIHIAYHTITYFRSEFQLCLGAPTARFNSYNWDLWRSSCRLANANPSRTGALPILCCTEFIPSILFASAIASQTCSRQRFSLSPFCIIPPK